MATFGSAAAAASGESSEGSASKPLTFGAAAEGARFGTFGTSSESGEKALFGAAPQKFGESSAAATGGEEGEEGGEGVPEAESTAEFTPVVQLEEVEVKTHEEEEDVMLHMRAKLYRYTETMLNKGSGKKEWIERGVGDMKLLKHRESERIRVLMRQEKTMKVIANHVVDPRIDLQPNVSNDRTWVWSCFDFSEGDLVEEVFATKFQSAKDATKFKETFLQAQDAMTKLLAGADGAPDPEADAAADALNKLSAADDTRQEAPAPAASAA